MTSKGAHTGLVLKGLISGSIHKAIRILDQRSDKGLISNATDFFSQI